MASRKVSNGGGNNDWPEFQLAVDPPDSDTEEALSPILDGGRGDDRSPHGESPLNGSVTNDVPLPIRPFPIDDGKDSTTITTQEITSETRSSSADHSDTSSYAEEPTLLDKDIISDWMLQENELGLDTKGSYLSDEDIDHLASRQNIMATLSDASTELIKFAEDNKKLFLLTVLVLHDSELRAALDSFRRHAFTDTLLFRDNMDDMASTRICPKFPPRKQSRGLLQNVGECHHIPEADAFHFGPWGSGNRKQFFHKRWSMSVPKFKKNEFKNYFRSLEVMPLREQEPQADEPEKKGAFSKDAMWVPVAIKELFNDPELDVEADWENESNALAIFNELNGEHIVKGVGAFKTTGKHYLLMEWADAGSLRQLWNDHPDPGRHANATQTKSYIKELRGLAFAIHSMHEYREPQSQWNSNLQVRQPANGDGTNWRHGDIKPENILLFKTGPGGYWRMKIGDLGRAKKYDVKTNQRVKPTKERWWTIRYEPPEAHNSTTPRSRKFDIWSFGCVIFESVIWLLFGTEELKKIDKLTKDPGDESPFWMWDPEHITHQQAKMRDHVPFWIQWLLDNHPECAPPSAIRDLLLLVRDKLLVIDVSSSDNDQTCRADSGVLCRDFDRIFAKGQGNDSYWYRGSSRPHLSGLPDLEGNRQIDRLMPNRQVSAGNVITNRTRRPIGYDEYGHDFADTWKLEPDNTFARSMLNRLSIDKDDFFSGNTSRLCARCSDLDLTAPGVTIKDTIESLGKTNGYCDFCALRYQVARSIRGGGVIEFKRYWSGLGLAGTVPSLPILKIRRDIVGKFHPYPADMAHRTNSADANQTLDDEPNYIQIGVPERLISDRPANLELLRAWVRDCDENHPDCRRRAASGYLPCRLIYVGSVRWPVLRLVETGPMDRTLRSKTRYMALSHPWGGPNPNHWRISTDKENIEAFKENIPHELPQTFKDAVHVTRELGIDHLWIDSLCVIQGRGGDFASQAEQMGDIFSSAYCVIAATSAEGSCSGFLRRDKAHDSAYKKENEPVSMTLQSAEGGSIKVHIDIAEDNFERDVRNGPLNKRGWVFQERALATRTVHFTKKQTYWECGDGIRCETFAKMTNGYESFLGDADFPSYGLRWKKGGNIAFLEFLFEKYSRLAFTVPEDRPLAIRGLERRLRDALARKQISPRGMFGLFEAYWGRGLLWQRATGEPRLTRLTAGPKGGDPAPSWSWMGYIGAITFLKPRGNTVAWRADEFHFPWHGAGPARESITARHGESRIAARARRFRSATDEDDADRMDIQYDDPDAPRTHERCIIVGTQQPPAAPDGGSHYVLIVSTKRSSPRDDVVERIGAGLLHHALIDFDQPAARVWIA